jgi:hypothetical protein
MSIIDWNLYFFGMLSFPLTLMGLPFLKQGDGSSDSFADDLKQENRPHAS